MLFDVLKRASLYIGQEQPAGDAAAEFSRISENVIRAKREMSLERCEQFEAQRKLDEEQDDNLALLIRAAIVAGAIDQPVEQATAPATAAEAALLPLGRAKFRRFVERAEKKDTARQELKQLLHRHRGVWKELTTIVTSLQEKLLDKVIGRGNKLRESASQQLETGRCQLRQFPGNAIEQLALERIMLAQAQIWSLALCYSNRDQLSDQEANAAAASLESATNRRKSALDSLAMVQNALSEAKPKECRNRFVIRKASKKATT
jgi:hypothetical protein